MQEVSLGAYISRPLWCGQGSPFFSPLRSPGRSAATRFYALVWHRALFDVSLFVILWGVASAVAYHTAFGTR